VPIVCRLRERRARHATVARMARKLRLTVAGGIYHVYSRGNRRQATFTTDDDRRRYLWQLRDVSRRFGWEVYAWCQMGNHDHLLVATPVDNLSRGMQRLKGLYAQGFNDLHGLDGHLYQGRFGSVLVERDAQMLELCRYLALNPVRAGLCGAPEDWPWSSYAATIGLAPAPDYLAYQRLLRFFGDDVESARGAFSRFVRGGLPSFLDTAA
jgi:REP-associated tyrosine transposase